MRARPIAALAAAAILVAVGTAAQRDTALASSGAQLIRTLDEPPTGSESAFGSGIAVGDVDGDGMADVLVGDPLESFDSGKWRGKAYLFSGADGSLIRTLVSPVPQWYAFFGQSTAIGDVNGDRQADMVMGASGETAGGQPAGRVHVFSGSDGIELYSLASPVPVGGGRFGRSVAVGDVNGDGKMDVIVGADEGANTAQGRVYVFSGADGALLYTLDTPNPQANGYFGSAVAAGDVNGDGKADVVVGAYGETVTGIDYEGRTYVFSGADGSLLYTLQAPDPPSGGNFGVAVAAGDMNGDGKADITVGAARETVGGNAGQGRAYVFSGADGSLLRTLDTPDPQANAFFGSGVAAGDVNGDGKTDITVGAYGETVNGHINQGRAFTFSGATGSLLYTMDSPLQPLGSGADFGLRVAAGDVNGDGNADMAVAASSIAAVYVFTGVPGCKGDSDCDGCPDSKEALLVPPTDQHNPWDFYSVPVPALFAAPNPAIVFRDSAVGAGDAQAVFAYFKAGAMAGTTVYEQDLNLNDVKDGVEYDRSVVGPGMSGPPDGVITATDAQLAFAQFKLGYKC